MFDPGGNVAIWLAVQPKRKKSATHQKKSHAREKKMRDVLKRIM
jgi:hypothetical protein